MSLPDILLCHHVHRRFCHTKKCVVHISQYCTSGSATTEFCTVIKSVVLVVSGDGGYVLYYDSLYVPTEPFRTILFKRENREYRLIKLIYYNGNID